MAGLGSWDAIRKSCGEVDFAKGASRVRTVWVHTIQPDAALHPQTACYRSPKAGIMRKWPVLIFLLLASSCSSKLETGYQPRPLDMPISQRETLYADP